MIKKKIQVKCDFCGSLLERLPDRIKKNKRQFCNINCKAAFQKTKDNPLRNRKIIKCKYCGKEKEINAYLNQEFCSVQCYAKYASENNIGRQKRNFGIKTCKHCGKKYEVWNYRKKEAKFCSTECYNKYRRTTIICPSCKKEFTFPNWEDRKYCSKECAAKGIGRRKSKFSKFVKKELLKFGNVVEEVYIHDATQKYFIDFVLNENIAIECNGDYWHCNPNLYSFDYYHNKIKKYAKDIWEHDREKIKFIKSKNYKVIVLWERDYINGILDLNKIMSKVINKGE